MTANEMAVSFIVIFGLIFGLGVGSVVAVESQRNLSEPEREAVEQLITSVGQEQVSAPVTPYHKGSFEVIADCAGARYSFAWHVERTEGVGIALRPGVPTDSEAKDSHDWEIKTDLARFSIADPARAVQALKQVYGTASPWCRNGATAHKAEAA